MVLDSSFGGTVQVKTGWDEATTAPGSGETGVAAECAMPALTTAINPTRVGNR